MFHFCVFGGHEGQLTCDNVIYVTICGGLELKRPTLAKQIIERRRRAAAGLPIRRPFFVTLFGATELKSPTLAEEFIDMTEAVRSGTITADEWDQAIAQITASDESEYGLFTVCGGFGARELPSENEEVDGLAINRHFGRIPDQAGQMLELSVGQGGSQRRAALRQALTAGAPA